jgi:UDP-N-acetylglucosamine acyltransferase
MNLRLEDAIEQIVELAADDSQELANMVSFLRNVRRGILR